MFFANSKKKEAPAMQTTQSDPRVAIEMLGSAGPPRELLRGHLPAILADPTGFLTRCARDHGDIVSLRLGPKRALLLNHPSLIEDVLVRPHGAFVTPFAVRTDRPASGEARAGDGDVWQRPALARGAFHHDRVEAYGRVMSAVIQREIGTWRPGDVRDVAADMDRLAFSIVTRTLFGAERADLAAVVAAELPLAMAGFLDRAKTLFLVPQRLPTPGNRRLHRARRDLDRAMDHVLARGAEGGSSNGSMLADLAAGTDNPSRVRDETLTFLLAGYETVASTMAWAWSLLAQHPEIDDALAAEVHEVLGGRWPEAADLERLPMTRHIVQEALRLYPPLWVIVRTAAHDLRIGGQPVKAGTLVLMSPCVLHRDPRFFRDPERFCPARWADGLEQRLLRYAYFPFGGGRRGCIGSGFAMLEAVLIVAAIAQRFRLTLPPGHLVRPRATITLRPEAGLRMVLHERCAPPTRYGDTVPADS